MSEAPVVPVAPVVRSTSRHLTFEQAEAIRAAKPTTTMKVLAERYQVSLWTINQIVNFHVHRPAGMPKPAKLKARRKTRFPRPCGCGCGEMTAPGKQFCIGHWSRVNPQNWTNLNVAKTDEEFIDSVLSRCESRDCGLDTPCLIWTGPVNATNGYAIATRSYYTTTLHRHLWQLAHGEIEGRKPVHHRCLQKLCCNIEHLELNTMAQHMRGHLSMITADDAAMIRLLYATGFTAKEIHFAYPEYTSIESIRNIALGRRWNPEIAA